jgi:cobalt-zinc-cadmium efflux system outer membrane protein
MVGALALLINDALADAPAKTPEPANLPQAPTLPATLTLDQAVSIFRERGYDLLIADATVRTAEGNLQSAAQIANPSIALAYGRSFGVPESESNAYSASLNDSGALLDTIAVGKRRLRIEVAQAALDSTKYSRTDSERTLVATLKQAWVSVVATKKQLDINADILKSIEDTEALVATRYRLGVISEADLAVQKTATYEAAQQVEIARQAYEQAKVALTFLLGVRGQTPAYEIDLGLFDTKPAADISNATLDSLHALANDHRPDVLAQRKQVERAEASIRSTQRQVVPDFALGVGYAQQGIGTAAVTPPTLSFDLTFSPPIFYHLEGELSQARADLRTQEVTLAKVEAQMLSDVDSSFSAFSAARRRLYRLDNGYLEQARLARDLTKIQYEKGAASLVELLAAQRQYVTTVSEYIQAENDFWTAVFLIEEATGVEFKS